MFLCCYYYPEAALRDIVYEGVKILYSSSYVFIDYLGYIYSWTSIIRNLNTHPDLLKRRQAEYSR